MIATCLPRDCAHLLLEALQHERLLYLRGGVRVDGRVPFYERVPKHALAPLGKGDMQLPVLCEGLGLGLGPGLGLGLGSGLGLGLGLGFG